MPSPGSALRSWEEGPGFSAGAPAGGENTRRGVTSPPVAGIQRDEERAPYPVFPWLRVGLISAVLYVVNTK